MSLTLRQWRVRRIELGAPTSLQRGVLTVDGAALAQSIAGRDERIDRVRVHLARPGEAVRVLCVKDVVQPRCKPDRSDVGTGVTHSLDNVAVVTCGPIVGFQEGIIDMSGPGAQYTPFSALFLVVLEIDVVPGTAAHEHEAAIRAAGLFAAEYLASVPLPHEPDAVEELSCAGAPADAALPGVVYVGMVLTQGLLHDTYVLGRYAADVLPCRLDPLVVLDGGVVSGNCVSACDKITTYHHQNNEVIRELLAGHGARWNFLGVVLTNEPTRLAQKQEAARQAIELIRELGPAGVVITKEGFGNPDADLMMIIGGLERAGIRTVAITDEYAGPDGASQSIADTTPEADALVSVGNANERITLPAMATIVGPLPDVARLAGGYAQSLREDGSMEVELQALVGATSQLGCGRLRCMGI